MLIKSSFASNSLICTFPFWEKTSLVETGSTGIARESCRRGPRREATRAAELRCAGERGGGRGPSDALRRRRRSLFGLFGGSVYGCFHGLENLLTGLTFLADIWLCNSMSCSCYSLFVGFSDSFCKTPFRAIFVAVLCHTVILLLYYYR